MPELDDSELDIVLFSPICTHCARLIDGAAKRCEAFEKIPAPIWDGDKDHRSEYPGDGGKLYRPR